MASPAIEPTERAAINRANAQHSTGPRSLSGKDRVRLNALKHGAFSRTVILPYEDPAAFHALGIQLLEAYAPDTPKQRDIVVEVQETHWRISRVLSIEAGLYADGVREHLPFARSYNKDLDSAGVTAIARAHAYREDARTFDQLHRQEMRLRRLLDRQVESFIALRDLGDSPDTGPDVSDAKAPPAREREAPAASSAAGAGFVLHNDSASPPAAETMPHFIGPLKEFKRKQWRQQHGG